MNANAIKIKVASLATPPVSLAIAVGFMGTVPFNLGKKRISDLCLNGGL